MKEILIILLLIPSQVIAKTEKRLALVIGNADYDKGSLNNPVNSALLMANTLDSLNFEVMLDTNLTDKRSFNNLIRSFFEY